MADHIHNSTRKEVLLYKIGNKDQFKCPEYNYHQKQLLNQL